MDRRVEEKGRSEAWEEGGSEADKTEEERKEGRSKAGRRKEGRVGPSNQVRHWSSRLTSQRYKSGRKLEGHLYGHKIYECIFY